MPYRRWVNSQQISRKRKIAREKVFRRAERVINNSLTEEKTLADFPDVDKFLTSQFPDVDLSSVKLYVAPPKVIEKSGWADIGGCYIRGLKLILVKNEIHHHYKAKGKFQKMMRESCNMKADVEDVIVHEFIHAVSDIIGRSLSRYQHMEEEFVYTNCIEFYHQKGMSDDDIVNNNFLPFFLQDIYNSPKEMAKIFAKVDRTIKEVREMSEEEYQRFLNQNAEEIVPLAKDRAQKKAHKMIELFNKYGCRMNKTSANETSQDKDLMRFSSLDLD